MAPLALWRWVLLRLSRSPTLWIVSGALVGGIPLRQHLQPLPSGRGAAALALEWSFPAALWGVALGIASLSRASGLLARLDWQSRTVGELGALALAGAYLQLPIFLGALLSGARAADLEPGLWAILLMNAHLASCAVFLLALPLSIPQRLACYLAALWVLPALLAGDPVLGWVGDRLDARALAGVATDLPRASAALVTSLAFALATVLLRTSSAPGSTG